MKKTLFITGITGFIGSNLMHQLDFSQYEHVFGVGRSENNLNRTFEKIPNFTFIKADILEPADYLQALKSSDIVIHMAALTGKASRKDYFKINRDATQLLMAHCQKAKIERFIFVSSIAAKFRDIKYYYYAQSKIAAEEIIKSGTIPYTILRPTMIIGERSPILASFEKMVHLPIIPVFGNGKTVIQPIFIKDLINYFLLVINHDQLINEIIEIGGTEKIEIEEFLKQLHLIKNQNKYMSMRIPVPLLAALLSVLEKAFLKFLPFTAGQLASFTNDGTIKPHPLLEDAKYTSIGIVEMLSQSLHSTETGSFETVSIKIEADTYTRYLIGMNADEYIKDKFIDGHHKLHIKASEYLIDQFLLKKARKNIFWTKIADTYARFFYPRATIRKKLLLLIAILECRQSTYIRLDPAEQNSRIVIFLKLTNKAIYFLCVVLISIFFFGPFHIINSLQNKVIPQR